MMNYFVVTQLKLDILLSSFHEEVFNCFSFIKGIKVLKSTQFCFCASVVATTRLSEDDEVFLVSSDM